MSDTEIINLDAPEPEDDLPIDPSEEEDSVHFAVYDPATGRIVRTGNCPPDSVDDQPESGEAVIISEEGQVLDTTHYVKNPGSNPQVTPRPALSFDKTTIVANGTDTATMSGLPNPTTVIIDPEEEDDEREEVITDGTLQIRATVPGVYTILIEDPFPAQAFEGQIIAEEP